MNQVNRYDFESEKIKVDYLIFNIKNTEYNLQKIGIKSKKPYFSLTNLSYTLEMVFVFHSNPGNKNSILIEFSGHNASQFYAILKSQKFNWQIFNLNYLTLGQLDIYYIMLNNRIDESNLLSFFKISADKFKNRYPNSNPQIIRATSGLGTRTGDFFLRVYTPDNIFLKFELEIKKYKAKQVTLFLVNNLLNLKIL